MPDVYTPEDTYDWLSLDAMLNLAKNCYTAACRESCPDLGQEFIDPDNGLQWADRADFLEALTRHLDQQLHTIYALQVMHKSTAEHAEEAHALKRAVATEGSCGPCE